MPSIMKPGGKKQNGAPLPSRRPPTLQPPRQRSELHIWVALMSGGDGAGVEKVAPLAREYKFIAKKSLRGGWYYGSLRGFVRIVFKSGAHSSARRRGAWPLSTASPPRASPPRRNYHACTSQTSFIAHSNYEHIPPRRPSPAPLKIPSPIGRSNFLKPTRIFFI